MCERETHVMLYIVHNNTHLRIYTNSHIPSIIILRNTTLRNIFQHIDRKMNLNQKDYTIYYNFFFSKPHGNLENAISSSSTYSYLSNGYI